MNGQQIDIGGTLEHVCHAAVATLQLLLIERRDGLTHAEHGGIRDVEGVDPTVLRSAIQSCQTSLAELKRQVLVLEDKQRALVAETQGRLGLGEREAEILALQKSKTKFIGDFDSELSQATRREEHRRQWMAGQR